MIKKLSKTFDSQTVNKEVANYIEIKKRKRYPVEFIVEEAAFISHNIFSHTIYRVG